MHPPYARSPAAAAARERSPRSPPEGSSSQGGMQSRRDRATEINPTPLCTLPLDQVPLCYYYKM